MCGQIPCHKSIQGTALQVLGGVIKEPYSHNLLGHSVAKRMGLVMRVNAIATDLLNDVFGGHGHLFKCDPVKIELKPDAEPYTLALPYPVSSPAKS